MAGINAIECFFSFSLSFLFVKPLIKQLTVNISFDAGTNCNIRSANAAIEVEN